MFYLWFFIGLTIFIVGHIVTGYMAYENACIDGLETFFAVTGIAIFWPVILTVGLVGGLIASPFWLGFAMKGLREYRREKKASV